MSEELQQKLRDQLWEVANRLRGNMSASDFMYFLCILPWGSSFINICQKKLKNTLIVRLKTMK